MKQRVIAARINDETYAAIAAKAEAEGVSLSAIAARLLSDALATGTESPDKPDWAIALEQLEQRVSQLEAQPHESATAQRSRKAKRRR